MYVGKVSCEEERKLGKGQEARRGLQAGAYVDYTTRPRHTNPSNMHV